MNEKAHWDKIADTYEDEIFDVFRSDKNGVLTKYFRKHGNPEFDAIDFGCGTGKALPFLSPIFRQVTGTDISSQCLKIAKGRKFPNISFRQADLTKKGLKFTPADFAFCCNVVMLPEPEKNERMLRNIQASLKKGGTGFFVFPSVESILYSSFRMMQLYNKEGTVRDEIPNAEFYYYKGSKRAIVQGIFYIEGIPTKHYLEPELHVLIENAGLRVTAIEKVEYDWSTEFSEPPSWLKEPFPWDWGVEVKR